MADLKKSFDEVKEAATGFTSGNIMTSLQKDVSDAMQIGDIDKPARSHEPSTRRSRPRSANPSTPTTPAAPTPETFVEAETHAAASEPLAITREVQAAPQDIAPARPTFSRTPKRHERRGHRGQQGAVDGSPDRAALAADQGAARLRHCLHLLLLLRQADLQRAGLAVRLGRRPREFEIHLHGAAGIFPDAVEAGDVRRGLHLVPDRGDADLHVRGARPLQARARRVPAVSDRDAVLLRARLDAGLFRRAADAGAVLARHAADRAAPRPRRSSCCPRSANICR